MRYLLCIAACFMAITSLAQPTPGDKETIMVMEIRTEIDPRSNRYVQLALEHAEDIEADRIIIDMNTFGGALNDADEIRQAILDLEVPVYVFINKNAASAGALISIACDSIYMAPGASIGAATVVVADGSAAPDKYQSYMRGIMRTTAEKTGRRPDIAEAMVDENLSVDSISPAGQVITFSTSEALQYGYCEGEVETVKAILEQELGLFANDYEIETFELPGSEKIISFFINPFISGILILIIIGGIYFELQSPGVGFPILASFIALVLYLTPYYLNGLAENWEIIAFFVGVILIALEIFVIPGFGVAGISGIILMVGSLALIMINNNNFDFGLVDGGEITKAVVTTLSAMIGSVVLLFVVGVRFTNSRLFDRVALQDTQNSSEGYTSTANPKSFVGQRGTAYTVLRPSGKIMIDDTMYDAYTQGGYIEKDSEVEVIDDSGTSLKVKMLKTHQQVEQPTGEEKPAEGAS
ncbi:MAG TPA: serine protease [Cytophagales bacterium]|nr:serine protease [Cytophagales bacterium]HAA19885.1 serine protease [Cytophagales bacterium]HAP62688.1 serine protease [Cytophagales bacterium]